MTIVIVAKQMSVNLLFIENFMLNFLSFDIYYEYIEWKGITPAVHALTTA